MKKPSRPGAEKGNLRDKLIGLGEDSVRKNYYPELQKQLGILNERVALAELVAEISQGLTEESDLRRSLQRCSDILGRRTDAAFVRIWTFDPDGQVLELQASSGLHTRIDGKHSRLDIKSYPYKIGAIARERKPLLTNNVVGNPQFHNQEWVKQQQIVAFAGYPLVLQQRLVGVIALFAQKPLNLTVLSALASIANQVAVGIERIQALDAYKAALAHAKESHETVHGILRSVADALLVIDGDFRILHMNQAAEALLGTSLVNASGQKIAEVTRQKALLDYLGDIDRFVSTGNEIDLNMLDMSRHEQRVIQARAARLTGRRPGSGWVVSLRDVTEDRDIARLKTEFISTAAHELRTPLTTIMGFAELLHDREWDDDTKREYLSYIIDKSESLGGIIDDLLDLSRIESGRGLSLNCSDWNIVTTLEKLVTRYRTEFKNFRFNIELSARLGIIHADHGKILQVLDNLFSNAIKYSEEGSEIKLKGDYTKTGVTITVADQGIGMSEDELARCCEKFYRADSSMTAVGGLGLGLSIARNVIESHGGTLQVDSTLGKGTTVTFVLPLEESSDEG